MVEALQCILATLAIGLGEWWEFLTSLLWHQGSGNSRQRRAQKALACWLLCPCLFSVLSPTITTALDSTPDPTVLDSGNTATLAHPSVLTWAIRVCGSISISCVYGVVQKVATANVQVGN